MPREKPPILARIRLVERLRRASRAVPHRLSSFSKHLRTVRPRRHDPQDPVVALFAVRPGRSAKSVRPSVGKTMDQTPPADPWRSSRRGTARGASLARRGARRGRAGGEPSADCSRILEPMRPELQRLADELREVRNAIAALEDTKRLATNGWTAAQVLDHLTKVHTAVGALFEAALDGAPPLAGTRPFATRLSTGGSSRS